MEHRNTGTPQRTQRTMKDRLRDSKAPRADVKKADRKFADQHPTPDDHSPDIVKPGTGAQATGQVSRS